MLQVALLDCVIGATDGSTLFVGDEVPVRRGEPGWAFVVVHVISPAVPARPRATRSAVTVDAAHRAALSAGHTGCHVAALALNAALADRWRKPVGTDGLGHPDFDQLAIVSSRITPDGAVDTYRVGRSLRKKGFDVDGLDAALPAIAAEANTLLAGWVATGAPIDLRGQRAAADRPAGMGLRAPRGNPADRLRGNASAIIGRGRVDHRGVDRRRRGR